MDFEFLKATTQDVGQLADIAVRTHIETFASDNDPVEFQRYLDEAFNDEKLRQLLAESNYHVWFLMLSGSVAGYFALRDTPVRYPVIRGEHPVEIERFYLDAQCQGLGLGRKMMDFCWERARALNADSVWLGVWENNIKAQRFYEKLGFQVVGEHDFWVGNDCQKDWLMQRSLSVTVA